MVHPYLEGAVREAFDAWLDATLQRYIPPLNFSELRRGVQALSSLYVERRAAGNLAGRAVEGLGKRGALACYYAALHFVAAHHAAVAAGVPRLEPVRRIVDLGCGTGAAGASIALALAEPPALLGIDRSGWALEEARQTWSALGLSGRAIRGEIPLAAPRAAEGDLLVFGWSLGELDTKARAAAFRFITASLHRGAALVVLEPLAGRIIPWWGDWAEALAAEGIRGELVRRVVTRPAFVADMDKAAGLDHQIIGARILAGRRGPAA